MLLWALTGPVHGGDPGNHATEAGDADQRPDYGGRPSTGPRPKVKSHP